jgi:hypothetical protein
MQGDAQCDRFAWMRSCLVTDVKRTLHAEPLGVSKTQSVHPGQRERIIGKGAGGGKIT